MRFKVLLLSTMVWSGVGHSKEISYNDIPDLTKANSKKVKSAQSQIEANEAMTGTLARSFFPEMNLFVGSEHFDSKGLGEHNSEYFGVEARVNVFNGLKDYWIDRKRVKDVEAAKIEARLLENDQVYLARKLFLDVVRSDSILKIYRENQALLASTEPKVKSKVKGGVISRSDLLTLKLIGTNLQEEIALIERERSLDAAKLKSVLGFNQNLVIATNESFFILTESDFSAVKVENSILGVKRYSVQAEAFRALEGAESRSYLPAVDLYANYVRQPYSEREILNDDNRTEFRAGVVASWKLGDVMEKKNLRQKYRAQAKSFSQLKEHHQQEAEIQLKTLTDQLSGLEASISNLRSQMSSSRNYYKLISDEYLRGVKSTSDLTGALSETTSIRVKYISLLLHHKLVQAQIDSIMGEN